MSERSEQTKKIAQAIRAELPHLLAGEYGDKPHNWIELGSTRRIGNALASVVAEILEADR